MSLSFTKLFSSITDSSIWSEDSDTRIVWVTMLAMADQDGFIAAALPGLAKRAGVSLENTEKAVQKFLAPDKYSRSQEFEGRRIVEVDGGWMLLNYGKYRDARQMEERREQNRIAQQRFRDKNKVSKNVINVSKSKQNKPRSAQAEAEAEAEEDKEKAEVGIPNGNPILSDPHDDLPPDFGQGNLNLTQQPSPQPPATPRPPSPARSVKHISDTDFISALRSNPAYSNLNVDRELAKMDGWLLTHPKRKKTRKFIVGWLNRNSEDQREVHVNGSKVKMNDI